MEFGNTDHPTVMRFSAAAQVLFQHWVEDIQSSARSGNLSGTMESHILKMPKTIASLALLFELVDGGRFDVSEGSIRRALRWAAYLRSHANRLYSAGEILVENGARLMIERGDKLKDGFTVRTVHKKDWAGLTDLNAVADAIELLVETNHCRELPRAPSPTGGRPTATYEWNPILPSSG